MSTQFATGLAKGGDSYSAGKHAATLALEKLQNKTVHLAVVFASSFYNYQEILKGVREVTNKAPLIGCSSSGEFTESEITNKSVAVALLSSDTHKFTTGIAGGLNSDQIQCLKNATEKMSRQEGHFPFSSALVMIDGLVPKGEESVLSALSALGPNVKFAGAAAGDDLKFKETQVFCDGQSMSDAAAVALVSSKVPLSIGVSHGHTPISPPLTVTKTQGNVVLELDGKNAFDVWRSYTRESAGKMGIDVDNLKTPQDVSIYMGYFSAGFLTGPDYKIRSLFTTSDTSGGLNFPCAVLEGTVLRVMEGQKPKQIESARKATQLALDTCRGHKIAGAIVFDCTCRALILQEQFGSAIAEIKKTLGDIPFIGLETYGEIAMELGQLSGFHNTTTVVVLIPD